MSRSRARSSSTFSGASRWTRTRRSTNERKARLPRPSPAQGPRRPTPRRPPRPGARRGAGFRPAARKRVGSASPAIERLALVRGAEHDAGRRREAEHEIAAVVALSDADIGTIGEVRPARGSCFSSAGGRRWVEAGRGRGGAFERHALARPRRARHPSLARCVVRKKVTVASSGVKRGSSKVRRSARSPGRAASAAPSCGSSAASRRRRGGSRRRRAKMTSVIVAKMSKNRRPRSTGRFYSISDFRRNTW